jgi:hypothetical protein
MAFTFLHRSTSRETAIRQALAQARLGSPAAVLALTALEHPGSYVGRRVTFFRAVDPVRATTAGIRLRAFSDPDAHPHLVVGSGHIETEGRAVITAGREQEDAGAPPREAADRTTHLDDERFVFWDTRAAATSTLALSEPAAAWLQAQSGRAAEHAGAERGR